MKIVQFSRSPTPYVQLRPKFFHPLNLDVQFQTNPPPSPNDNQSVERKHNSRMTIICYEGNSGRLLFSVSTH